MVLKNNFAENLKKYRCKNNLTQAELASKMGVSRATLSYYERGTSEPDLYNLISLSQIFNLSIDQLIFDYDIDDIKTPPKSMLEFNLDNFSYDKLLSKLEKNKEYYTYYLNKINREIPIKIEEINSLIEIIKTKQENSSTNNL